jgi:hypothetical protein
MGEIIDIQDNKNTNRQIIRDYVDTFDDFVKQNFVQEGSYYVFNEFTMKKISYDDTLKNFIHGLSKYYHKSKQFYLEREFSNIKVFNTILRQIMKRNNVKHEKKVKYHRAKYFTEYHIYIDDENNVE